MTGVHHPGPASKPPFPGFHMGNGHQDGTGFSHHGLRSAQLLFFCFPRVGFGTRTGNL